MYRSMSTKGSVPGISEMRAVSAQRLSRNCSYKTREKRLLWRCHDFTVGILYAIQDRRPNTSLYSIPELFHADSSHGILRIHTQHKLVNGPCFSHPIDARIHAAERSQVTDSREVSTGLI